MKRKNLGGEDSPTKRMKMNNDEITDATEMMDLLSLPVDIHAIIFLKVHTNDVGRSRRVCKYLKEVIENIPDLRWAILFQSNFGLPELARPPGGLLWRKQYKYSVSVLKNLASVDDICRTREIASDITDLEAEQFKFSDLAETLLKMPEMDRKKLIEAKSTWAIRVSYYRLTDNLIRHGIFHFNPMFFAVTLQQGYEEVLNVLWNEKMYDNNALDRYFALALGRGSDWHHWAKKFIDAGAKGDSYVYRALIEDDANLLEKLLKVGLPPGDLQHAQSKETLKLLLDYGAVDSFQAVDGSIFSFRKRIAPESTFMSLIENGNYDMAELLLLSGKAKGIEQGLTIAQQKNSKFAEVILKYLQQ